MCGHVRLRHGCVSACRYPMLVGGSDTTWTRVRRQSAVWGVVACTEFPIGGRGLWLAVGVSLSAFARQPFAHSLALWYKSHLARSPGSVMIAVGSRSSEPVTALNKDLAVPATSSVARFVDTSKANDLSLPRQARQASVPTPASHRASHLSGGRFSTLSAAHSLLQVACAERKSSTSRSTTTTSTMSGQIDSSVSTSSDCWLH